MAQLQDLKARVGQEVGTSAWVRIDQDVVDRFADLTDDHQFIHVDADRAAQTPFGGTIAHGFLIVSMLVSMMRECAALPDDSEVDINYGFDRLRMTSPVKVGSRVRAVFTLDQIEEKRPGQTLFTYGVTVEVDGEERPAIICTWLLLSFFE